MGYPEQRNADMSDYCLCQGCLTWNERSASEFVCWGRISCHFCKDCLELVETAKKNGSTVTVDDLKKNKKTKCTERANAEWEVQYERRKRRKGSVQGKTRLG